jgi:hypothetical protein
MTLPRRKFLHFTAGAIVLSGMPRSAAVSVSRAARSPTTSGRLAWITSRGNRLGTNRLASASQNAGRMTSHASLSMGRRSTTLG